MDSKNEQQILEYTITRVKDLFEKYPAPSHSFDHAEVVANFARQIATEEKAKSVFICELAGYLHDIGRAAEHHDLGYTTEPKANHHHELSYLMLRDWFKEPAFEQLSAAQKNEVLYAIRNHWNNFADKYDTAWILRDADKLDCFGPRGLTRNIEHSNGDETRLNQILRNDFECYFWLRTQTAKNITANQKMLDPILDYYEKFLKDRIQDVQDFT